MKKTHPTRTGLHEKILFNLGQVSKVIEMIGVATLTIIRGHLGSSGFFLAFLAPVSGSWSGEGPKIRAIGSLFMG